MHRRIIALVLFVLTTQASSYGQAVDGIKFQRDLKWAQVLALAKAQNKLVFVDVYTDWCGPCKKMDAEIFPLQSVADKYNKTFINYKIDAEKGEGIRIAKRYHIRAYPNYLFVNGDGVLIYRSTSAVPEREFLLLADIAQQEAMYPNNIEQLDSLYALNRHRKEFMYDYVLRRTKLALDNRILLNEYAQLLSDEELGKVQNLQLFLDNGLKGNLIIGKALSGLIEHEDHYANLKQKYNTSLNDVIENAKESTLNLAIKEKNRKLLDTLMIQMPTFEQEPLENKDTFLIKFLAAVGTEQTHFSAVERLMKKVMSYPLKDLKNKDSLFYKSYMKDVSGVVDTEDEIFARQRYSFNYIKNNVYVLSDLLNKLEKPKEINQVSKWLIFVKSLTKEDNGTNYKNLLVLFDYSECVVLYKIGKKNEAIQKLEGILKWYEGSNQKSYQRALSSMKNNELI